MVPILLFMVVALAVAGGVLYVTKTRAEAARAQERREAGRPPEDRPEQDPPEDRPEDRGEEGSL